MILVDASSRADGAAVAVGLLSNHDGAGSHDANAVMTGPEFRRRVRTACEPL